MELIIFLIIAGLIFIDFIKLSKGSSIKCPNCKTKGNCSKKDKIDLGANFSTNDGQLYRIYFKCSNCNYKWSEIKEVKNQRK